MFSINTAHLLVANLAYGFARGCIKTSGATIYDLDEKYTKYERPIMITERLLTVGFSTIIALPCAPMLVFLDLHNLEYRMRGYQTKPVPSYNCLNCLF